MRILLVDNYDSFTFNVYQMLGELVPEILIRRNDAITPAEVESLGITHLVLSPGPGHPKDAGVCEDLIRRFHNRIPILGICLGHQAICEVFGGEIGQSKVKMHGKQSSLKLLGNSILYTGIDDTDIQVARYHSLSLNADTCPRDLVVSAVSQDDGEVMSVECGTTFGTQFHPESILTPLGGRILANFVQYTS
ncbi:MAG: aminodeoxychorismate/anthranilate synthase component II [Candidatus Ancillula sp.]|jgi:anthranilate synthase/aminodeoxychorismate synthase-like glutamine amidotransferase|nr:aminodeoxychorismate/anthranilate synthase component II [Candidatus Ancillula sp.]